MSIDIRRFRESDLDAGMKLWTEAFGDIPAGSPPRRWSATDPQGRNIFVADEAGTLVGTIIDREYRSWFGGREVATAGIAGVTVRTENRGNGILDPLFETCLAEARQRGAVVSTMYPTAAGIYRRFGYEVVGALEDLEFATADLAVAGDVVPLRRAEVTDVPALRAVYQRWAQQQHGPLTRTGPSFPTTDRELVEEFTGITVAESSPGQISGYCSWQRGEGYGESGRIKVSDLFADDRASMASLLRSLAGHASVAPRTVIRSSGFEPWRLLLRSNTYSVIDRDPYGLAVLDVQAFAAIGYPGDLSAELPFRWRDRGYVLNVADGLGHVSCESVPDQARTFTDIGLALAFAGSQSAHDQRALGHLVGSSGDDLTWDALIARPLHIRDYF